tara:strand:- start:622 stop:1011 length:390 start_codon:yes stop_codon:yes gene_type:complete
MTPQVDVVTLGRKEYDTMREDLRKFNAGAVIVHRREYDRNTGRPRHESTLVEVRDVEAFLDESVANEVAGLRKEAEELRKEAEGLRNAVRVHAAVEDVGPAKRPIDIGQAVGGFLAGAFVTALVWWCTL